MQVWTREIWWISPESDIFSQISSIIELNIRDINNAWTLLQDNTEHILHTSQYLYWSIWPSS